MKIDKKLQWSINKNNMVIQIILILKYYLYKCRCLGDKPNINGGLKYLKYCIKIEKTIINFLFSTQKEYTAKPVHAVTCIKRSPLLSSHLY